MWGFLIGHFWLALVGSLPLRGDFLYKSYIKYKTRGLASTASYSISTYAIPVKASMIAQQQVASSSQQKGKGKLACTQEHSPFVSSTYSSTSFPFVATSAPTPMPYMGSVMVPIWRKAKHQIFELPTLPMVLGIVVYSKGKCPHGVSPMSWPSWPPTIPLPTTKVEKKKKLTAKAPVFVSLLVIVFFPYASSSCSLLGYYPSTKNSCK